MNESRGMEIPRGLTTKSIFNLHKSKKQCWDSNYVSDHSLVSLSQLLHLIGFSLSRSLHDGDELLVRALDLLLLNGDLLLPLHHLDFDLLHTDFLLLFGSLQLVSQLSLSFLERLWSGLVCQDIRRGIITPSYLCVHFLIEGSLLHFQLSLGVGHFCVS